MNNRENVANHEILGTPVAATDYWAVFHVISNWARDTASVRLVEAANTHVIALARHDKTFGQVMGKFDLVLPDGMPLVWVLNRKYKARLSDRVYGPTLMAKCFEWSQESGQEHIKHYLLGGTPEVLDEIKSRFGQAYPDAQLVGSHSPPFRDLTESDLQVIFDDLTETNANFVWVCLGCPKQEKFLAQYKDRLPPGVYFGIGAAFAFHAGVVRQAPKWIQKIGCEWLFRMAMEPRRLFKRYITHNSLFLYYLFRDQNHCQTN